MAIRALPTGPTAVKRAQQQIGAGYLSPMPTIKVPSSRPAAVPAYTGVGVPHPTGYSGSGWNMPNTATGALMNYGPSGQKIVAPSYQPNTITHPPEAGAPNSPSGISGDAASNPRNFMDYYNEAMGLPAWAAATENYAALTGAQRGQARSAVSTTLANLGYDIRPNLGDMGEFSDLIDPTAIAAGTQNPLSSAAQIQKQYDQGSLDALYAANARGTLGSGASTAATNSLLQQSQLARNTAQNDAITAIRNAIAGYTTARGEAQQNLQTQQFNIMNALAQAPGPAYQLGTDTSGETQQEEPTQPVPGTAGTSAPLASARPSQGISWGGQTFTSPKAFNAWLTARGSSYNTWLANHRAAAQSAGWA